MVGASGDTLIAGSGNDTLVGNGRYITFGFATNGNAVNDVIYNFQSTDSIALASGTTITNLQTARNGTDLVIYIGLDPITIKSFFTKISPDAKGLYNFNVEFGPNATPTNISITSAGQIYNLPPVAETDNINANNQGTVSGNVLADNGNGADFDPNGLSLSVKPEALTTTALIPSRTSMCSRATSLKSLASAIFTASRIMATITTATEAITPR